MVKTFGGGVLLSAKELEDIKGEVEEIEENGEKGHHPEIVLFIY